MSLTPQQQEDRIRALKWRDTYRKLDLYYPDKDTKSLNGKMYYSRDKYAKAMEFFKQGANYRQRGAIAGNGTGKTEMAMVEIAYHVTGMYPKWWCGFRFTKGNDWWICGKAKEDVSTALEPRLIGPLHDRGSGMIPRDRLILNTMKKATRQETKINSFQIKHISGEISTITFKSYDSGDASFRAWEGNVWLDEEPPFAVYDEALERTRMGGILMMTFTPTEGMSDTIINFTNGGDTTQGDKGGGRFVVNINKYEVPHLDHEAERLKNSVLPEHIRLAREYGIPSTGEGAVYKIVVDDHLFNPKDVVFDHRFSYCMAIDFGYTHPTAVLWCAYDMAEGIYYIFEEYKMKQQPPEVHAQYINMVNIRLPVFPYMVCDPSKGAIDPKSGRHVAEMYKDYELEFQDANNDVDTGIFSAQNAFSNGKLKISTKCVQTIQELRTYQFAKPSANGKTVIKKINDDLMDCMRYIINEDYENFNSQFMKQSSAANVATQLIRAQQRNKIR